MKSPARPELDSMIVEIELTLVSIIQGVALTFLVESAGHEMSAHQIQFWPYVLAGLFVIFVFWSRSVLHIITVIRWPLEFGHNFLYVTCALVEALLFSKTSQPFAWFATGGLFGFVGWILFTYDLRLIRARIDDSPGPASNQLCKMVLRDQWLNILMLVPAIVLGNFACAAAIHFWPAFFIARGGHIYLIAAQVIGFATYLYYVVRHYAKLAPLILEARAEWLAASTGP